MGNLFQSPQVQYQTPPLPSYLQNYLQTAGNWLQSQIGNPSVYPGPFTADISPWTSQGITNVANQATAAAPLAGTGFQGIGATAAGAYLPSSNPYIQQIAGSLAQQAQQQMQQLNQTQQQQFAQMGLGNSTPLMETQARIAGQVIPAEVGQIGGILSNAYQQERQNQINAQNIAATLPGQLAGGEIQAGQIPQQTLQNLYGAQYGEFQRQIQQQQAAVGGFPGLASNLQQPTPTLYGPSGLSSLLSGAAGLLAAPLTGGSSILGGLLTHFLPNIFGGTSGGGSAPSTYTGPGAPNPYQFNPGGSVFA